MKLMHLLDCLHNRLNVNIYSRELELLYQGFAIDVPESMWDTEVYLIEPCANGVDITLVRRINHDYNANNQ